MNRKPSRSRSSFGAREPVVRQFPPYEPPRSRWMRRYALLFATIWAVFAGIAVASETLFELPDTANLLVYDPTKDITLLDVNGKTIARRGMTQGSIVSVGELPDYVGNAFIAVEDRRFRSHFGIDLFGLARAIAVNWREGTVVQGGSTLTQQLAKNLFLKPDRTLKRKFDEAFLALSLERRYSKDEILTLYLNRVYFGAGVYGIEAASQRFFGKPAKKLTLTEAALLAGSVKAPSRYNPETSPETAMERAQLVLDTMAANGFIDEKERRVAMTETPRLAPKMATPGVGYFVDYAAALAPSFAGRVKERVIVETTLDLDLQEAAEHALDEGLMAQGAALQVSQGAIVAMTPDGAIRALVGGRSYDESGFDRATEAMRQPGSAFKPFVYLAALEHGHKPSDQVFDGPVAIGDWRPDNYEGAYEGAIPLSRAFAHSSNSAAVQLTREVGPKEVARVAQRLGIASELHAVPSLALGTSEVSLLELTGGYAAFANGGLGVLPYAIVRIRTVSGREVYHREGSGLGRVMSQADNTAMTQMMRETVTGGTGRRAALPDREVAGKTGTSQSYRDAWFVGFTADFVCGVWTGNDTGASMKKATGGVLPARIFKTFMSEAEHDLVPRPLQGQPSLIAESKTEPENDSLGPLSESSPDEQTPRGQGLLAEFQTLLDRLFSKDERERKSR